MNTGMTPVGTRTLCLPPQVAPVERKIGASALGKSGGVEPSFDWGGLLSTIAPIAAQVLPGLLSAI
jgi:hypothetical protein